MINEKAGHVWWRRTRPEAYDVYLETDRAVYRCSSAEGIWREVNECPDPGGFIFSAPLKRVISKCLSASDGCRFVLFSDNTAIQVFNPPDEPGGFTICNHAAGFLDQNECSRLLEEE